MENIAIISGGFSGESVISVQSAKYVASNLDPAKFQGFVILIDKSGWYFLDENQKRFEIDRNDFSLPLESETIQFQRVFNIIHGDPGENGKLTAYFEMLGIPSTSCDSGLLGLTFNKYYCNQVVKSYGVNTAANVLIHKGANYSVEDILENVGLPCFVKPNSGGSSIGMSKVKTEEELAPAINLAFEQDNQVMIETFIKGREITCGLMISKGIMHVLPLCEVVSKKEYFDFEAKYNPTLADELIPAPIDSELETVIKSMSSFLYRSLGCNGVVRMDYIVGDETIHFLEVNTIPGMSAASIVPQMARAYGWTNQELISRVLDEIN